MRIEVSRRRLLWALSSTIDLVGVTDLYHGKRVAYIADCLRAEWPDCQWSHDDVVTAGLLHDCGVSSTDMHEQLVLNVDWAFAHAHCERGAQLLSGIGSLAHLAPAIRHHHTAWNKLGSHPDDQLANLLFTADRIDVMAMRQSQDILISRKQVLATIESYAGILFNPALVDIFRKLCLRDRFWLDWQHSHTDLVMGAWYRSEHTEPMDYFELKETFQLFSSCVDGKSPFTYNHSVKVSRIATYLASCMGFDSEDVLRIELAALLHDIGKLRVPDAILEKPGPLDSDEVQIMRHHSYDTYSILDNVSGLGEIVCWAMQHHEKLNGTGYPGGANSTEIPLASRIIAVADIFQALAQNRPYREGLPRETVLAMLSDMTIRGEIDANVVATLAAHSDELWPLATKN